MRNIFLMSMIFLNCIAIAVTLILQPGIDYLSLRVIFVAFTAITSFYLILLHQSKPSLFLAIGLFMLALIHISIIAKEVYHYIY